MNLILLGAPGAGKGTQAEKICDLLKIPAISTGNIIRAALKEGTEMGQRAKTYMDAGQLVPDDVVIGIIQERLQAEDCKSGFILDGFPRTIPQAQALEDMGIRIDKVIDLEVTDEAITKRMSGRRVCAACAASYHLDYKPSKVAGKCDKCGGELVQRKDDHPDTVQKRLVEYHAQTEPLKDFYSKLNKLCIVEGQDEVEDTTKLVFAALED